MFGRRKYQLGGSFQGGLFASNGKPENPLLDITQNASKVDIQMKPTLYDAQPNPGAQMSDLQPEGSTRLSDVELSNPNANFMNNMDGAVPRNSGAAPVGGGKFGAMLKGAGKNAQNVLPYVSNMVNAFRRIPKPGKPELELPTTASLVNYDSDRVDMDNQFRGMVKGFEGASANPAFANANRVAALSKFLDGRSRISQMEKNTNAQIQNQNNQENSRIAARNVERNNDYKDKLVQRTIAQQNHNSANLANFSDKFQMQRRDKAMMELEKDKLAIIPRVYNDTGVVDRNILDLLKTQQEKQGGTSKRYGGQIQRYFNKR